MPVEPEREAHDAERERNLTASIDSIRKRYGFGSISSADFGKDRESGAVDDL